MADFECDWCLEYFELKDVTYMANINLYQCKSCFQKIKYEISAEICGICLKKRKRMEGKAYCEDCDDSIIIPKMPKSAPDEIERYNINYSPYQFRCKGPPDYFPDVDCDFTTNEKWETIGAFMKLLNSLEVKNEVKLIEGNKSSL